MKMMLMISFLLGTTAAFAANDQVKVCNPSDPTQAFEVVVKNGEATMTNITASSSESNTMKVSKTIEATPAELNEAAAKNNMNVTLVSGTAYAFEPAQDVYLIATDKANGKHLFMVLGGIILMGSDSSCAK